MNHIRQNAQPSIKLRRFTCPHCGAFADQPWYNCWASPVRGADNLPQRPDVNQVRQAIAKASKQTKELDEALRLAVKFDLHLPQLTDSHGHVVVQPVNGLFISVCASCSELCIWAGDSLIHPNVNRLGPPPNEDLNDDIKADFEEARQIIGISPRGAAALCRLALQKLCVALGEPGKDINSDIASLVKNGLSPTLQKALDTVRVIGNESVHPGQLDLRDNQEIAISLLGLINLITEQLISTPKRVHELYEALPQAKRDGIDKRDNR